MLIGIQVFKIMIGTNIKDGDLSPCIGIKYVGFDDKRHYNMKFTDFGVEKLSNGRI